MLREIWDMGRDNKSELIKQVDGYIYTSLYGALKNKSSKKNKPLEKQKGKNHRQDGGKRTNKNRRKRNSYARCQETFYECPRKLADAIINDD